MAAAVEDDLLQNLEKCEAIISEEEWSAALQNFQNETGYILQTWLFLECRTLGKDDIRLLFADRLLLLLTSLAMDLKACSSTLHQQPMNELSLQEHKVVSSALQFLDVFGILPYLKCGFGIPLEKRFPSQVLPFIPVKQEGHYETNHLIGVMTGILVMIEVQELLALFLSSPVCVDVLAAFLQLVHHCDDVDKVIQKHLKIQLYKQFLPKIPQVELVKLLMLLMGTRDIQASSGDWLRQVGQVILNQVLLSSGGVRAFMTGITDAESQSNASTRWDVCNTVARIVVHLASRNRRPLALENNICPQLLELLNVKNEEGTGSFLRILGTTLDLLHKSHPEAISVHIFTPLFSFLSLSNVDISDDIERLHRLFVAGTSVGLGSAFVTQGLGPHIWSLICIHAESGVSYLKNILGEILLQYFESETEQRRKEILEGILGIRDLDLPGVDVNIHVKPSSGGGLVITSQPPSGAEEEIWLCLAESVCDLIIHLREPSLLLGIFLNILQSLSSSELSLARFVRLSAAASTLSMKPSTIEAVLQCPSHSLAVLTVILERGKESMQETSSEKGEESESLLMAIVTATCLLSQVQACDGIWTEAKALLPILRSLSSSHTNPQVRKAADELHTIVAMHGLVLHSAASDDRTMAPPSSAENSSDKNVEKLDGKEKLQKKSANKETFEDALHDVCDPLLPVQGHGIITLSRLLLHKDPETLQHLEQIFAILQRCLKHEDSYVYLSAIQGLVALGTVSPNVAVPVLAQHYSDLGERDADEDTRLKVGEALVRITKLLVLTCIREGDPILRASSLSCLANLCAALNFALGPILQEVLSIVNMCCEDKNLEVRRGAANALQVILRGLGKNFLHILGGDVRDVYRQIKSLHRQDPDPIVQLHAQLALEELDSSMKELIASEMKIEKKIRILHPSS
ncbi:unnamed protein product [Darwinula stevensoni]|uniref:Uncharacterized protein n=1 Tax=Darwinula stevensoni TaxID=69355 RepID=A0A7R9A9V1_9CRUS|nr:unnamed protein product [Darwinula stevensoni]CAG0897820.1 unnamed protein product [Darwinula stevensoni]